MKTQYDLKIPQNVVCGAGCSENISSIIKTYVNDNIIVFVDAGVKKSGAADNILFELKNSFLNVAIITDVPPEPEDGQVKKIFDTVKSNRCDIVVALGGGSVLDTAKMIAVMLNNPGYYADLTDKSKIVNRGKPLIAIPTSAGTGSEATPNAIVLIPEKKLKVGVVHDYFLPTAVLLDPVLTVGLPAAVTASTGLDAFCHCIETFISKKSNPLNDLFSLRGISMISDNIRDAYNDGKNLKARENMLLAAFYGGIAISCSSTVAVHALSYPLGGSYHMPHGVSNAILLPYVMEYNMDAIGDKVYPIAAAMKVTTENKSRDEVCADVIKEIFALVRDVKIPASLREFKIGSDDIDFLTTSASEVHRLLDQNPKEMSLNDIRNIYLRLM